MPPPTMKSSSLRTLRHAVSRHYKPSTCCPISSISHTPTHLFSTSKLAISYSTLRNTTSRSPPAKPLLPLTRPILQARHIQPISGISRPYSTGGASSIESTIDSAEKGIQDADELASGRDVGQPPDHLSEKERHIWDLLKREFGGDIDVKDISGGCGSMYGIEVASERFRGLSVLKQQRLVNQVLGEEIKAWHGVQLKTRVS